MANNQVIDEQLKNIPMEELKSCTERGLGMLTGKKYCNTDLVYIVENSCVSLWALLKSQHLTADFCVKYMLVNNNYCIKDMDKYITYRDVIYYQTHLNETDLDEGFEIEL